MPGGSVTAQAPWARLSQSPSAVAGTSIPGDSSRIRNQDGDPQAGYAAKVPMQRAGDDHEIANAVAFLASDLSGFITGAFIPVCGGNVMPCI